LGFEPAQGTARAAPRIAGVEVRRPHSVRNIVPLVDGTAAGSMPSFASNRARRVLPRFLRQPSWKARFLGRKQKCRVASSSALFRAKD
jgi:hypothetical protein